LFAAPAPGARDTVPAAEPAVTLALEDTTVADCVFAGVTGSVRTTNGSPTTVASEIQVKRANDLILHLSSRRAGRLSPPEVHMPDLTRIAILFQAALLATYRLAAGCSSARASVTARRTLW
jgi:hypothetical protein